MNISVKKQNRHLDELRNELIKVKKERYGWRWEIDAAYALCFPTYDFNYSISPRYGIWSNISYRPKKNTTLSNGKVVKTPRSFEFIGFVRWLNSNDDFFNKYNPIDTTRFKTGGTFDLGIRAVFEISNFSAEFEYIYRFNQNKEFVIVMGEEFSRKLHDNTYKFILNLNYNIREDIIVSFNIGKNYKTLNSERGNLISGFTLNFGFGSVEKANLLNE